MGATEKTLALLTFPPRMHAGPGSVGHVAAIVIASFAVMTSQFTGSAPMARNDDGQKKSAVATTTGAAEKRVAEQARQAAGRHRQQSSSGHIPGQSRNRADDLRHAARRR